MMYHSTSSFKQFWLWNVKFLSSCFDFDTVLLFNNSLLLWVRVQIHALIRLWGTHFMLKEIIWWMGKTINFLFFHIFSLLAFLYQNEYVVTNKHVLGLFNIRYQKKTKERGHILVHTTHSKHSFVTFKDILKVAFEWIL